MKRALAMAVVPVAVSALLGACTGSSGGSATAAAPADLTVALAGLCRAEDFARAGDLFEARRAFLDRSHAFLHELAARGGGRARLAVARLLEGKQRVEAALGPEGNETPAEVADLLRQLEVATRALASALGTAAPRCGGGGP
jgi:predicted ABC-type transport system involved in lysophospholipase L1 biosynthesis ATPase subunit